VKQLWEYATTLEGLTRGVGVHAAGVVICDRDLSEYIPLTRANDGSIVSQYSMAPLTDLGMLKMDFLGLKTLTVITDAVVLIHKHTPDFDIDTIPLDNQATYDLLNRGETIAIFQLESGGMVNVCKQFELKDIEDINAILALYRPGPMDLIPDYIKRKKGSRRSSMRTRCWRKSARILTASLSIKSRSWRLLRARRLHARRRRSAPPRHG
jgi:DNA polymerase-3 subunit alpha